MNEELMKAQQLFNKGRYDDSLEVYRTIMDHSSDEESIRMAASMAFYIRISKLTGLYEPDEMAEYMALCLQLKEPLFLLRAVLHFPVKEGVTGIPETLAAARKLADEGSTLAMMLLGQLYGSGKLVEKDEKTALEWFEKGAGLGDPVCMMKAAGILDDADFEKNDPGKAAAYQKRAAELGFPDALYSEGRDAFDGKGQEKDIRKAYELMDRAAGSGLTEAAVDMWRQYLDYPDEIGAAIPDFSEGRLLDHLKLAAYEGNDDAMLELGRYYCEQKQFSLAEKYYKEAMDAGNFDAPLELSSIYLVIKKSEKDHKKGIAILTKAARDDDNPEAMAVLGSCYLQGLGVRMNRKQGMKWLRKGADLGCPTALSSLGSVLMDEGKVKESLKYLKKAADMGDPEGLFLLGGLYLDGTGVEKNRETAAFYFRRAVLQGMDEAREMLGRMTLGEI